MNKHFNLIICVLIILFVDNLTFASVNNPSPRIVNVINFVRLTEPRSKIEPTLKHITDEVLYKTVVEQINLLNEYNIHGTFLLQYDVLINIGYQNLFKTSPVEGTEIGAWWEITQPHVEAAGLKWRGRYVWDWHADVGFSTGYTPEEREKLVDVYMEKFKEVFGKYPASVGSWFIDAHSLAYMNDKYQITASCNCRDQIGTDGYNLWGGYWGQGFYPSRKNSYMPGQTKKGQIDVPVFRMLGSDPIYQYDSGLGGNHQGVITLEPLCAEGGGSEGWVKWFFKTMFENPCLTFTYTQVGQENSFTWEPMEKGMLIQIPLLSQYQDAGKIRIETLEESGKWFKSKFKTTPPTAIYASSDYNETGKKTVWFNSRYYRANLFWDNNTFRFRDIHLFDERYESDYLTKPGDSPSIFYSTLPIVDGNVWSSVEELAGLRLYTVDDAGAKVELQGGEPKISGDDKLLTVTWSLLFYNASFVMTFDEKQLDLRLITANNDLKWFLALNTNKSAELPFTAITDSCITAKQKAFNYKVVCKTGTFVDFREKNNGCVFHILPQNNRVSLSMNN